MNDELLSICIVMEMLAVNLFTVDICSKRKYSILKTLLSFLLFTAVLTIFTKSLWDPLGFHQGNALFAIIGTIYLIPLSLLYQDHPLRISGILFSAWIYTLLIYTVSVRLSDLFWNEFFLFGVLVIQSILYLITLYGFIFWIKKKFLFVLKSMTDKNQYLLQIVSLCWFISIIIINANLTYPEVSSLQLAAIFALAIDAVLTYFMIVSMFKGASELKSLQNIVYIDPLTGLLNRERLFADAQELIQRKKPFSLLFMDLNHFKSINDQYGHQTGDKYLVQFTQTTKSYLSSSDQLYRMSGDEFIILSQSLHISRLLNKLHNYPKHFGKIQFLGCSIGIASYPQETMKLDELIYLADQRMYQDKHPKSQ